MNSVRTALSLEENARSRKLTIHKHIPRRRWQRARNPVQFARDVHLASQTRGICKPERHVEHVVLVVVRLGQLVVELLRQDDVAC